MTASTPTDPADDAAVIGVWSSCRLREVTVLQTDGLDPETSGKFVQVSRLGMPLVNEVVIPLADKNKFNNSEPEDDVQFLDYVLDPEPATLLNALYGVQVPPTPRNDLVSVFLTGIEGLNMPSNVVASEQMRLNMAIAPTENPDRLGRACGRCRWFPKWPPVGR